MSLERVGEESRGCGTGNKKERKKEETHSVKEVGRRKRLGFNWKISI